MQLNHKKQLAAKVLGVGKNKVVFVESSLNEIKEAITRQDILDLHKAGAIIIKEANGRRKVEKRKHRRGIGKVKKKVNKKKRNYVLITRKLRKSSRILEKSGKINREEHKEIRKMIKANKLKSKKHLLDTIKEMKN